MQDPDRSHTRRITDKRPEPTRLLAILRQIEDLSFGDFMTFADHLSYEPGLLHENVQQAIKKERVASEGAGK